LALDCAGALFDASQSVFILHLSELERDLGEESSSAFTARPS
jgi:hypothetical protein